MEFYNINLVAFNDIFGFLPNLDLFDRRISQNFNPNSFSSHIKGDYHYDSSTSKGIIIRNICIPLSQNLLVCRIFVREASLTML